MQRFFPSTFRRRGGSSFRMTAKPAKPTTAAGMLQHASGKTYTPGQLKKEVRHLAAHPEQARTAEERAFLRSYYGRQKVSAERVKTLAKGMYQLAAEENLDLKYNPGTITEKAAKFSKEEIKRNTPPPAHAEDTGPRTIDKIRAQLRIQHGPQRGTGLPDRGLPTRGVPTGAVQEPEPLPGLPGWMTESSGFVKRASSTPALGQRGGFTYGRTTTSGEHPAAPFGPAMPAERPAPPTAPPIGTENAPPAVGLGGAEPAPPPPPPPSESGGGLPAELHDRG